MTVNTCSRSFMFGLAALALVIGCKSKPKTTDESTISSTPTTDTAIDSTPMSFDASGSDSGKIPGLETVHFDYDKASISAENKRILQGNADWIKKNTTYKVQIEGH